MNGGYMGRVLWVDLSTGKITEEGLDEQVCRHFIGGYGLGAHTLFDRQKPHVDPLGPDNTLGFVTGPLTGTPAITGCRFVAVAKSPLTNTWGDANCGAAFGPTLKSAGYDAVYFVGKADKPVFLFIDDGKAELRDAGHLWGKDSILTRDWVKAEYGAKAEEVCIGPAGEMQTLLACIITAYGRAAGRSGLGAVMGSKRLKAVIVRGDHEVPLANADLAKELRRKYIELGPGAPEPFSKYGTAYATSVLTPINRTPCKNWTGVGPRDFPTVEKIGGEAVVAEMQKRDGCWHCHIRCGGTLKAKAGRNKVSHKPEYETIGVFGPMCLNDDLESIIQASDIVNAYGLDSMSTGATVAFAIDCYEHGIIDQIDTDGLELRWGNAAAIVALTGQMARREGFGAVLADGVKKASERIGRGSAAYAIHVQGQEPGMHDPRYVPSHATSQQLDATPGRHTQGGSDMNVHRDLGSVSKYEYGSKGELHRKAVLALHMSQSAGLCHMGFFFHALQALPDFLNAVIGWDRSLDDYLLSGERIANVRHAFNLREGLNPLRFAMPGIVIGNPPLTQGDTKGVTIDMVAQNMAYMKAMHWDPETAMPSRDRLEELGMSDVAEALGS